MFSKSTFSVDLPFSEHPYPPMSNILSSSARSVATQCLTSLAPSASVSQAPAISRAPVPQLSHHDRIKSLLIAALEINPSLTDRSKATVAMLTLPESFIRFKAIVFAKQKYKEMVQDKSWLVTGLPSQREQAIIEIFIGKSLFYEHWEKIFDPVIANHPAMCDWLEGGAERSALQVWGLLKNDGYDRDDLRTWLELGGTLKVKTKRRKEDKEGKSSKSRKGKEKETEESSPKKKDKHRKAKNSKR